MGEVLPAEVEVQSVVCESMAVPRRRLNTEHTRPNWDQLSSFLLPPMNHAEIHPRLCCFPHRWLDRSPPLQQPSGNCNVRVNATRCRCGRRVAPVCNPRHPSCEPIPIAVGVCRRGPHNWVLTHQRFTKGCPDASRCCVHQFRSGDGRLCRSLSRSYDLLPYYFTVWGLRPSSWAHRHLGLRHPCT